MADGRAWTTGGSEGERMRRIPKAGDAFGGVVGRSPAQVWTESISEAVPPARAGKRGIEGGLATLTSSKV